MTEHAIGHLPFEAEVGGFLSTDESTGFTNRLTIAVNNTLNHTTIPPSTFYYATNDSYYMLVHPNSHHWIVL